MLNYLNLNLKSRERCIRIYFDEINGIKHTKNKQSVYGANKNKYHPKKGYHYEYMYYPASEGLHMKQALENLQKKKKLKVFGLFQ